VGLQVRVTDLVTELAILPFEYLFPVADAVAEFPDLRDVLLDIFQFLFLDSAVTDAELQTAEPFP
jgi:hypothetical protein